MDQIIKKSIQSDKPTIIEILIDLEQICTKARKQETRRWFNGHCRIRRYESSLSDQEMANSLWL